MLLSGVLDADRMKVLAAALNRYADGEMSPNVTIDPIDVAAGLALESIKTAEIHQRLEIVKHIRGRIRR